MSSIGLKSSALALLSLFACAAGCSAAPDGDPTPSLDRSPAQTDLYRPGFYNGVTHFLPPVDDCAETTRPTVQEIQIGAETSGGTPIEIDGRACAGQTLDVAIYGQPAGYQVPAIVTAASDGTWAVSFYTIDCGAVNFEVSVPNATTTFTDEVDVAQTITCP